MSMIMTREKQRHITSKKIGNKRSINDINPTVRYHVVNKSDVASQKYVG
jgi:hypothetical protein